jgi:hypothetical protein
VRDQIRPFQSQYIEASPHSYRPQGSALFTNPFERDA